MKIPTLKSKDMPQRCMVVFCIMAFVCSSEISITLPFTAFVAGGDITQEFIGLSCAMFGLLVPWRLLRLIALAEIFLFSWEMVNSYHYYLTVRLLP
jgi:hypothetical protein